MDVTPDTASEHVRSAEQRLRELFARKLAAKHGSSLQDQISKKVRGSLETIRDKERAARPNAREEPHLLGYAGFDHLIDISHAHWECCLKETGLWPSFDVMKYELGRLQAVRNPAAHGRTLFPHEYIEGEGMARRMRTEIERLWRQEARVSDQYWLYIEEAEDSLGNRSKSGIQVAAIKENPDLVYEGDVVHFRVRAFDPLGRQLKFSLMTFAGEQGPWQDSPEFEWTAKPARRTLDVRIKVIADKEPHAMSDCDAFADFRYEVRPRTS
jgi:hypothetical protein